MGADIGTLGFTVLFTAVAILVSEATSNTASATTPLICVNPRSSADPIAGYPSWEPHLVEVVVVPAVSDVGCAYHAEAVRLQEALTRTQRRF